MSDNLISQLGFFSTQYTVDPDFGQSLDGKISLKFAITEPVMRNLIKVFSKYSNRSTNWHFYRISRFDVSVYLEGFFHMKRKSAEQVFHFLLRLYSRLFGNPLLAYRNKQVLQAKERFNSLTSEYHKNRQEEDAAQYLIKGQSKEAVEQRKKISHTAKEKEASILRDIEQQKDIIEKLNDINDTLEDDMMYLLDLLSSLRNDEDGSLSNFQKLQKKLMSNDFEAKPGDAIEIYAYTSRQNYKDKNLSEIITQDKTRYRQEFYEPSLDKNFLEIFNKYYCLFSNNHKFPQENFNFAAHKSRLHVDLNAISQYLSDKRILHKAEKIRNGLRRTRNSGRPFKARR